MTASVRRAIALARFRALLAYRRGGGLLGVVALAAAAWAADELGRRVAGAEWVLDPATAGDILVRAVAGTWLVVLVVAWPLARARARSSDDTDGILDVQPLSGRMLAVMHVVELALALCALAGLAAVAVSRPARAVGAPWAALASLAAAPATAGLAFLAALRPWPMLGPLLVFAGAAGCALAWPRAGGTAVLAPSASPILVLAGVAAVALAVRVAAPRLRRERAIGRDPRRARRAVALGVSPLARVLGFLPRSVRALFATDLAFIVRGTHLRGKVAVPLLWCVPLAYLVWPIPPRVAGAPLLVAGMLSAFGLAGIGFVLGADLAVAERPYLALRRTSPVDARAVWWSRLLLAVGAGCVFASVLAVAILVRHGRAGVELLAPIAVLGILVPAHAAAIGLAADAANDTAMASAIAMSTACVAALALVAWVAFAPLLALYPLMMRGTYARALTRWRRVEVA